jgi:uncharacterized protein (TIGR04255 family)
MGTRLSKAPVCFTLAQMRFNPVLAMDAFLPAVQDEFRTAGFPDYSVTPFQTLELSPNPEGGMRVRERTLDRHVFLNRAGTAALLLDPGALTYELSDYPVFDEFSATFLKALNTLHEHRTIEYSERLGMRMLDAVQPLEDETLDQYLVAQALGFQGLIDANLEHQQTLTESMFKSDTRTLMVRSVRVSHGVAIPLDLAPLRLTMAKRFLTHQGETVMLDCDSFRDAREDFSLEAAATELRELKSALTQSFKTLVTPHALDVWK